MKNVLLSLMLTAALMVPSVDVYAACAKCKLGKPCAECKLKEEKLKADCPEGKCEMPKVVEPKSTVVVGKANPTFAEINTEALKVLIKSGTPMVILDARSGKWDDGQRIPGAKSLTDKSETKDIEAMILDKDMLIVTYCSNTKCPASDRLANHLKTNGYRNILEYHVGIQGWIEAGNQVEKSK